MAIEIVEQPLPDVPNGLEEICKTFGDPRPLLEADGSMSAENQRKWSRAILARGELPFAIPLAGAPGFKTTFWAHFKLVHVFEEVFRAIEAAGLESKVREWGGVFSPRLKRGGKTFSTHYWAIAVDLNPTSNPLGFHPSKAATISQGLNYQDAGVVQIFKDHGFAWGGDFHGRPDPMHFQYATGY